MEPTILYKKGGLHRGPKGLPFSYKGVTTEEQLDSLLKDGWFLDLETAVGLKTVKVAIEPEPVKVVTASKGIEVVSEKTIVFDTGVVKSYDELTDDEKKEIGADILSGKFTDKEIWDKYNVHHLTFKKLKADVLD